MQGCLHLAFESVEIVAPVAARIAHLPLEVGSSVAPSDTIAILEVMKMEQ